MSLINMGQNINYYHEHQILNFISTLHQCSFVRLNEQTKTSHF